MNSPTVRPGDPVNNHRQHHLDTNSIDVRELIDIVRQRWWVPVTIVILVAVLSAIQLRPWQPLPERYGASMRLLVGVLPATEADTTAYDPRYYAWLTSEYLVDDFTEVVRSALFAGNVSERLAEQNLEVPPGLIQGSAATGKQHRIITLNFQWHDRAQLETIANAAAEELTANAPVYFRQLGTEGAGITLLDGPDIGVVAPSLRERLEWPLRVGLALFIGIALVFVFNYMDTSVRRRSDIEAMDLPVLGEIPKHR